MLRMKNLTGTISDLKLAGITHKQMNIFLIHLGGKKNFNFYDLGMQLRESGPLGTEIVEGGSFPQFKALIIEKINEITARMTPEDALTALVKLNGLTDEETILLKQAFTKFHIRFQQL